MPLFVKNEDANGDNRERLEDLILLMLFLLFMQSRATVIVAIAVAGSLNGKTLHF